jgi:hypothetical protein
MPPAFMPLAETNAAQSLEVFYRLMVASGYGIHALQARRG